MKIISPEDFESSVLSIYEQVFEDCIVYKYATILPSRNFDCMRLLFNEELPIDIQINIRNALANITKEMGDRLLYISFPWAGEDFNLKQVPRHFSFTIDEFQEYGLVYLVDEAQDLIDRKIEKYRRTFWPEPIIYSSQGLWAVHTTLDFCGWLAMRKNILSRIRSVYPEFDEELERQLFDTIRLGKGLPTEWKYRLGEDREICTDWLRDLIKYMCQIDFDSDDNIDLIETYRKMLHQPQGVRSRSVPSVIA